MGKRGVIMRHRATIVTGAAIALLVMAAFLLGAREPTDGSRLVIAIHAGDGALTTVPLDTSDTVVVDTSLGHNVIVIERGMAHMSEADCPHGDCLRQQPISRPGEQLICLPHNLWAVVCSEEEAHRFASDATMDTNAVTWTDTSERKDDKGDAGDGTEDAPDDIDLISR